jgi:hypothetical protein
MFSRRELARLALGGASSLWLPRLAGVSAQTATLGSRWAGVQVGIDTAHFSGRRQFDYCRRCLVD